MNELNTKIVEQFLQSLTQRNLSTLVPLFSEEVDWYIPGDVSRVPWLGRQRNRKEIEAFFVQLWEHTAPVSATINHILTEKETAIIAGEFSTKMLPTGKIADSLFFIQMTIRDGQIVQYRLLEDSFAVSVSMTPDVTNPANRQDQADAG